MISIIIPCYNSEKSIQKCLESIFQSKYQPFEVIVVDDTSTDASIEIFQKYPVKVISLSANKGCAFARNKGAKEAKGEILFFVDSDVLLEADTINKVVETFTQRPEISATFGSYSKECIASNFFSVYKNLLHYYTHQTSSENATSFWTGCGAIKKAVFERFGGFDTTLNYFPIEDIALGYKISKQGGKIYLNKQLQVKHLKSHSFFSLIKSDFIHRAIPWTRIILKERFFTNDLNLKTNNILSVIAAFIILFALLLIKAFIYSWAILFLSSMIFFSLNSRLYGFILREKGLAFTLKAIPMNYFFYLYSGVGLLIGVAFYIMDCLAIKHNREPQF